MTVIGDITITDVSGHLVDGNVPVDNCENLIRPWAIGMILGATLRTFSPGCPPS